MRQHRSGPDSPISQLERVVQTVGRHRRPKSKLPVFAERTDRLLAVLGSMKTFVSEFDESGALVYASPQLETVLGFEPEEALATGVEFHPDDLLAIVGASRMLRESDEITSSLARARHKQGHWVWIESSMVGWAPSKEGKFHTIAFSRDITDLKNAETARAESEERYRIVSLMSCDLISEFDENGQITYVGPGSEETLGYTPEEMLAFESFVLVHPEDKPQIRAQFEAELRGQVDLADPIASKHQPPLMEFRIRHRDGRWLWFETMGLTYLKGAKELRYLSVSRNVTATKLAEQARRELEQGMLRAQKLESLGVLAGGIAHDFNNLLTPILGHAALGFDELPEHSPVRARLRKIQEAANRVASLTNQMLAYAGQQSLCVESLDLSKLVEEMYQLATSSVSGKTILDVQLDSELPAIRAEAAQLSQVVLNLVTNAAESLGDGVGRITLRTGTTCIDAPPPKALFSETMKAGRHVFLEVRDTGSGMDPITCAKIFDPFFTTKFTGRGLGLAAVAGIVRSHNGSIEVESQPGHGTLFRVLLPAMGTEAVASKNSPTPIDDWRTTGTALVIDDDDSVRELASDILRRAGMLVLSAADGHEGLKLFDLHTDAIRVVLLDRTMPNFSGADTFLQIRSRKPDAKIILMSGYSEERATADLTHDLAGFLMKPFEPTTLLSRVRSALEGPTSP